jgi:NAD+ dependent glucose-6-phosphate dehydrogenase
MTRGAQRIAITGSSGMIGSRLAANLDADFEIVRVDRPRADVLDISSLNDAFADCTAGVHLAAGVLRLGNWDEVWETNTLGVRNVFDAAVRCGCRSVIYASSLHVVGMYEEEGRPGIYAAGDGPILGADVAVRPANPYGATKACGEVLARYYSDVHGLRVGCIRIGTMTAADDPRTPDATSTARLRDMPAAERTARLAAKWFSHGDLARLVRAMLRSDVRFGIVYGVSDNPGRFVDLEPGRRLYGFWPKDGSSA